MTLAFFRAVPLAACALASSCCEHAAFIEDPAPTVVREKPSNDSSYFKHEWAFDWDEPNWDAPTFDRISLRRGGCFGTCPVYQVDLFRGGGAQYIGGRFAPRRGAFEAEIGLYRFGLLCSVADRTNLVALSNSYRARWTDDETITFEFETSDGVKRISDYGRQGPPELQAYRALFDEIVEKVRWQLVEENLQDL